MYELYTTDNFLKGLKKLDKPVKQHLEKILEKIKADPTRFKPLRHLSNTYRVRFEGHRVTYRINGDRIELLLVKKRKDAYKDVD